MPESIISQFQREYNAPIETNRQVATVAERDAIPSSRRWEGMLVYVTTDARTYELRGGVSNGDWTEFGGITEAPTDGNYYVRRNGIWTIAPSGGIADAPSDGSKYGRLNGAWSAINEFSDAPSDGNQYARQDGAWSQVAAGAADKLITTIPPANLTGSATQQLFDFDIPGNTLAVDNESFEVFAFFRSAGMFSADLDLNINFGGSGSGLGNFANFSGSLSFVMKCLIQRTSTTDFNRFYSVAMGSDNWQMSNIETNVVTGTFAQQHNLFISARDSGGSNGFELLGGYVRKV